MINHPLLICIQMIVFSLKISTCLFVWLSCERKLSSVGSVSLSFALFFTMNGLQMVNLCYFNSPNLLLLF